MFILFYKLLFSINYHNINNTMDAKVHSDTLLIKQNEDDKAHNYTF